MLDTEGLERIDDAARQLLATHLGEIGLRDTGLLRHAQHVLHAALGAPNQAPAPPFFTPMLVAVRWAFR
mgnify:CR=1 FL=1